MEADAERGKQKMPDPLERLILTPEEEEIDLKEQSEIEKLTVALDAAEVRELRLWKRLVQARREIDRLRTTVDCPDCSGTGRRPVEDHESEVSPPRD